MEMNCSSKELEAAYRLIEQTSVNLFLTGKAGTGKTTFLRNLTTSTSKRFVVLAPTGVAAINAGGVTIHSFFQLSFAPFIPGQGYTQNSKERYQKFSKQKIKLIRTLDLIIIDEISMVRPDVLDAVDRVLRRLRNPLKPFGGIQLLLIGDLRQLAPVVQPSEWQLLQSVYASPYFFESVALKEAGFRMIELTKVYRQTDKNFIEILNCIRDNRANNNILALLNRRADPGLLVNAGDDYIRLTTHNRKADDINRKRLDLLTAKPYTFKADISGEFPDTAYPAEPELTLKTGAKVMFIKNDISGNHEYYNGLLGEVTALSKNEVVVRPVGKNTDIRIGKVIWERISYSVNKAGEIVEKPEGTFSQIPLRLAWSITIHKSQGLTFDKAVIDASHSFAPGQTYVALSRCRTLDGLILESPLPYSAIMTDPVINNFIELQPRSEGSDEELNRFKDAYYAEMLYELFDFNSIDAELDSYYRAVASALGKDNAQFVDAVSNAMRTFQIEVSDVSTKLSIAFSQGLPRKNEPAVAQILENKIKNGSGYFIIRLKELKGLIQATPDSIKNKTIKKRVKSNADILFESLVVKINMLYYFTNHPFDPVSYIKQKTNLLLKTKLS